MPPRWRRCTACEEPGFKERWPSPNGEFVSRAHPSSPPSLAGQAVHEPAFLPTVAPPAKRAPSRLC